MIKIKAVIFDMDGVLIDAKEWHYEALNRALKLFGYFINRYDHLVTYDGLPTRRKLEMLSLERGLPIELHEFINQMKQIYTIGEIHDKCKPHFFHENALAKIKSEGYLLGVASNSIRQTVELMMEKSDLLKYLDLMLSNEDVTKAKPDPEIYLEAMKRLEVSPKEVLILEDNQNGIKAARESGAHVLVVKDVSDVNYENIKNYIVHVEKGEDV